MPKFAANLTMLFQEQPFLDRFAAAREAGFEYVEYLFPYAYEPQALEQALSCNGLKQVLFNLPPGDWEAGERGIACHPDRVDEFKKGIDRAIEYALKLNVKQLNCLAGLKPKGATDELAWNTMLSNVDYAASQLALHEITLLVEPINSKIDMPGFFIDTLDKSLHLISMCNHQNLKIQFDLYHMQIMQGDLIRTITKNLEHIGHIQFADNPGRHEPGTGEINFDCVFKALDELGYSGWVSAEYIPSSTSRQSLRWLRTFN